MAPCTCNLCKQVVHTHPPLCGVAFNKSFHDKVGLFMRRKETRRNSNSLGKRHSKKTERGVLGLAPAMLKEMKKKRKRMTAYHQNP